MVNATEISDTFFAAAVLEYSLAPDRRYPRQIQQPRAAIKHLVQLDFEPNDIFYGGDSTDAHLALGLLSHAVQKSSSIEDLRFDNPLAGVFFISPWLSDDASTCSCSDAHPHVCLFVCFN
jgi:acetyl esterase/lipase